MSGGVDSSTAAWLLREAGCRVEGAFMSRETCPCDAGQLEAARRVAEFLEIPLHVVDLSAAFEVLIDYFCSEYLRGRTPNPCAICNEQIKFARLIDEADRLGFDYLATGHYVRSASCDGRRCLRRASDAEKDQSYYLFALSQKHLARAAFPLGDRTKDEVRGLARKAGLPAAETEESQDVCFVPQGGYARLVRERVGSQVRPGDIVDTSGKTLGRHEGIIDFTVGQRRGVGVAAGEPVYVVDVDPRTNRVVVGRDEDLLADTLVAENVNWVGRPLPREPLRCAVQIRYRAQPVDATVIPVGRFGAKVSFDEPQRAVTPGQAAVFYDDELLLGGGWITREQ